MQNRKAKLKHGQPPKEKRAKKCETNEALHLFEIDLTAGALWAVICESPADKQTAEITGESPGVDAIHPGGNWIEGATFQTRRNINEVD